MDTQASYDAVADEYVRRIADELEHKPFDRRILDRFAAQMRGKAVVCELGCGPGHVARYLQQEGVSICGMDLSAQMVAQARRLTPEIDFTQGDMTALDVPDASWAGIIAFYSIIHIPRPQVVPTLREWRRVLRPGGLLLLSFHLGGETVHLDEWWERKVSVDFHFFQPDEMAGYLNSAGFEIDEIIERDPYPEVEHQSRRGYVFAQRPA